MIEQAPLPLGSALWSLVGCVTTTAVLLARRRIRLPRRHVGMQLRFADGTSSPVYRESLLNTPLFVGFPGFVSKLWLAHDDHGVYRGLYEWDGSGPAGVHARTLWRVLALVSMPGSIHYKILPGLRRDDLLGKVQVLEGPVPADWWRVVKVA